jgi:hypothetical protein
VERAAQVVVVADGARWMWNRISHALQELGVESSKCVEVLDFYHASEHISEAAKEQRGWSQGRCVKWSKTQREKPWQGEVAEVIEECRRLEQEQGRSKLGKLANYLENNKTRCGYDQCVERGIPCGSGVIESAVRQVLGMRVKGNGKFWKRETGERMIRFRSWYVSGRLEQLYRWSLERRAAWCNAQINLSNLAMCDAA